MGRKNLKLILHFSWFFLTGLKEKPSYQFGWEGGFAYLQGGGLCLWEGCESSPDFGFVTVDHIAYEKANQEILTKS